MKTKTNLKIIFLVLICLPFGLFAKSFQGVKIQAKLIGGQQYERLYSRIKLWEDKTGAKVEIISKKSHFELNKEIKSDIAAGTTSWCIGSNHTSFAPQYTSIYTDLRPLFSKKFLSGFNQGILKASTINGKLEMLPRAQFDVRALYYQKSLYESKKNQRDFLKKYGYALKPPKTWNQVKDQAIFFSKFKNMYGTQFAGKDEALVGTFYEFLISDGGQMFDKNFNPTFDSKAGEKALQWFVDLYKAKAVPAGTVNYVWDELGQGFASGTIAIDFDWAGWAGYFSNPKDSKVANNLGIIAPPKGSVRVTGWSGTHGFSITKQCKNKKAAASLIEFLTNDKSQLFESEGGSLPSRTRVWKILKQRTLKSHNAFEIAKLKAYETAAKGAFGVPKTAKWDEVVNAMYPLLQKAILGDLSVKTALKQAQQKVSVIMKSAY